MKLFLTLLLSIAVSHASPNIDAGSYVLLDAETGTILAEKNAQQRFPPASLTKLMSTYLFFEAIADGRLSMEQKVSISKNAWASNVIGSKMFIEVGEQIAVQDLLRGVIVQSGNDATIALAEALAGDEMAFVAAMNERAQQLQLHDSFFVDVTGLSDENYSSATDMATLTRATIKNFPELYKIYSEKEFIFNNIRQANRNRLLFTFEGADGVKTGYTRAAGYCLVSSVLRQQRRLIAVVMQTKSAKKRVIESKKLMTYGFNQFYQARLFERDDTRSFPIWGGQEESVLIAPAEKGVFTLRRGQKASVKWSLPILWGPITAGTVLGQVEVWVDDAPLHQINLTAVKTVPMAGFYKRTLDTIKVEYLGHGQAFEHTSKW